MNGKTRVLIYGTPGIGKSFFLQRLLVYIVETAQANKTTIPTVNYVRFEKKTVRDYMLLPDGSTEFFDAREHGPDYQLSDAVDLEVTDGKLLSLEVASDKDSNYNQFQKRVEEASSNGLKLTMPLFQFDELLQIKPPSMVVEEAQFRFDVFGGSARNFINMTVDANILEFVEDTMVWYFGTGMKDLYPISWTNILGKISQEFQKSKSESDSFSHNLVNSMMLHKIMSGNRIWATKFMEALAGVVMENREAEVMNELRKIIGHAGYGNLFESIGHRKLTTCPTKYFLKTLSQSKKKKTEEKCFQGPVVLIRSVSDINKLPDGAYGLPLFSNFPLVDAIVQPDILLQFTTSPVTHKGSSASLPIIRSLLREKKQDMHKMIFVIPKDNLRSFTYQTDLPDIQQYITCADTVASAKVLQ